MRKLFLSILLIGSTTLHAENNTTQEKNSTQEQSSIISSESNITKEERTKKQLQTQMEKEKKYAEEQRFYQGSEHDLSGYEVDPNSLDDVPLIEPDYDFDMDDVYD